MGSEALYTGTHRKHSRGVRAWDHIVCQLLDPGTFTMRCNAVIVFPRGMLIAQQQTLSFATPKQVFKIDAATGAYRRAKGGTVTVRPVQDAEGADFVIRY